MGKAIELIKAFLDTDEINTEFITDTERNDILKQYSEGYKAFLETDKKIKSTEKSVEDFIYFIRKTEKIKREQLNNISNVMTEERRKTMLKYFPEKEKASQNQEIEK